VLKIRSLIIIGIGRVQWINAQISEVFGLVNS